MASLREGVEDLGGHGEVEWPWLVSCGRDTTCSGVIGGHISDFLYSRDLLSLGLVCPILNESARIYPNI